MSTTSQSGGEVEKSGVRARGGSSWRVVFVRQDDELVVKMML